MNKFPFSNCCFFKKAVENWQERKLIVSRSKPNEFVLLSIVEIVCLPKRKFHFLRGMRTRWMWGTILTVSLLKLSIMIQLFLCHRYRLCLSLRCWSVTKQSDVWQEQIVKTIRFEQDWTRIEKSVMPSRLLLLFNNVIRYLKPKWLKFVTEKL